MSELQRLTARDVAAAAAARAGGVSLWKLHVETHLSVDLDVPTDSRHVRPSTLPLTASRHAPGSID